MSTPTAPISSTAAGAREAARRDDGQFGTQHRSEADVDLVAPTEVPAGPKRLRSLAQVRESDAFCDDMEQAAVESRVRNVSKGDWVRDYGADEWGVVKSIGMHTLTTDVWRDEDTDEGDHVVEVVYKDQAQEIIARHGVIPTRAQNAYAKRRKAATDVADRFVLADEQERRSIGYHELGDAARDVWRSAEKAGLASSDQSLWGVSKDSIPEVQAMEKAFYDYESLLNAAGHSDQLADKLVGTMRDALDALDRYFGDRAPAEHLA